MTNKTSLPSSMQLAFRQAGKAICKPNVTVEHPHVEQQGSVEQNSQKDKSYAQVAPPVQRQAVSQRACGLKPVESRVSHIGIRFAPQERNFIVQQAKKTCLTLSEYIRASALGPGYAATIDPMKRQLLQDVLRELNRQGNNLNQIARHLNAGDMEPDQGERKLSRLEQSLIAAQRAVRAALAEGKDY